MVFCYVEFEQGYHLEGVGTGGAAEVVGGMLGAPRAFVPLILDRLLSMVLSSSRSWD